MDEPRITDLRSLDIQHPQTCQFLEMFQSGVVDPGLAQVDHLKLLQGTKTCQVSVACFGAVEVN
jgi:hypothetical protein